jgi:kumamolisin
VFFAASGDSPGESYPCTSPNIVCVGGTTFNRNPATFALEAETAWDETGSGISLYEKHPSYQAAITTSAYRVVPDVAALANPDTPAWICDTNNAQRYGIYGTCWYPVGGTSLATPLFAGIVNAAGSFKSSSAAELTTIYHGYSTGTYYGTYYKNWKDITYGYCYYDMGFFTAKGWDPCTGVGSPYGYAGK